VTVTGRPREIFSAGKFFFMIPRKILDGARHKPCLDFSAH